MSFKELSQRINLWNLRKTLFGKISLIFCIMLLLLAGIQVVLTLHFWQRSYDRAEQIFQWDSASYLAALMSSDPANAVNLGELERTAFSFTRANAKSSIYLLDETGQIVHAFFRDSVTDRERVAIAPIQRFFAAGASASAPMYGEDPDGADKYGVFSAAPINFRGRPMILYIILTKSAWRDLLTVNYENAFGVSAVFWSLLSLIAISLTGLYLFHLFARRFTRITSTVRSFSEGDFSQRIGFTPDDELGLLGSTIDEMAKRIESSISELKGRDVLRRELLANVSHDLRAPVGNIQGYFEGFLGPDETTTLKEITPQFRLGIQRNISYLTDLLNQLFELAKLEAQELKPDFEDFPIDQLIDDLISGFTTRVHGSGVTLKAVFETRPIFVHGDIRMLDRTLMNLIENAFKFTPAGGSIVVRAGIHGDYAAISVSDSGSGIAPEDLPKVFEKFYQGERAPQTKGSIGLGLAIVERLLRLHGSSVFVESEPGQGTRFSFQLKQS